MDSSEFVKYTALLNTTRSLIKRERPMHVKKDGTCPMCHRDVEPSYNYCPICGQRLEGVIT